MPTTQEDQCQDPAGPKFDSEGVRDHLGNRQSWLSFSLALPDRVRRDLNDLFGISSRTTRPWDGKVVTINPRTGVASPQVTLPLATPLPSGQRFSVDFNPVPNLLRIVSSGGTAAVNLAANVDDRNVAVAVGMAPAYPTSPPAPPNPFGGVTPSVIAVAYTNGAGAKGTLLFDIDDATDALYIQQPPAAGTLVNVANQLGISPGQIGFDIRLMPNGRNRAFLINGNRLFNPDLLSGTAGPGTRVQGLSSPVRDLAVLPLR